MRVMKNAADTPVGEVPNAVMFHARLQRGMTMLQIVQKTKSLGRKIEGSADGWTWHDAAGDRVELHFERGRLARWSLSRADADEWHTACVVAGVEAPWRCLPARRDSA